VNRSDRRTALTTVDHTGGETTVVLDRFTITTAVVWRQVEQEAVGK